MANQEPKKYVAVVSFYVDGENKTNIGDTFEVAAGSKTTWGGVEIKFGNLRKAIKAHWVVEDGTPEAENAKRFAEENPEEAGDFPHLTRGREEAAASEESDIHVGVVQRTASVRPTDGSSSIIDAARPVAPRPALMPRKAAPVPPRPAAPSVNQKTASTQRATPTPPPRPSTRTTIGSTDGGVVGRTKTPLNHLPPPLT